ncbi:hypothetical protein AMS68_002352 [Peltaster fructicola]|uniref:Pre-mRNA-splicing factor CWC22 n=1 Tax=Peltaster fructicola TaxID=286661 RepID=A0A6H0XQC2_9PEZI|nr:hypothetical protein AMS68_002352 [Peltaster fructicola]
MAATLQSAVRIPTPEPHDEEEALLAQRSRKRSPVSRSPSPRRDAPRLRRRSPSRTPPRRNGQLPRDVDHARAEERARQLAMRQKDDDAASSKPLTAEEKQAKAKAEYDRLLNMRSGGTYIPPARLKALQEQITDKTSKEYQRMAWEALKKSINGLINKVNVSNIKHIVPELFTENLIRGRGLFCRSIMKAQAASLPFTPIYAAMAAVVNTKLPQVGELLANRLITQFRKAYKRNDKSVCHSSTTFLAHLINQQVVHEMLAAQILLLLLHKPTDDSVEIAVGLTKEVGAHMEEMNPQIAVAVFDQFRNILHEADIDKRVQYMIEVLFQVRKDGYKNNPALKEELDLVDEEDQITHRPSLEDKLDTQEGTNIFKFDAEWEASEEAYRKLKAEILGEVSGSEDEEDDDEDASSSEDEEDEKDKALEIKDQSNTDLVNLRRSIYLTIMSSGGFEEACHKLMRINLPAGREEELPSMIIECCSQERTYNKFFGLIGERFCKLNRLWRELFQTMFAKYYETIHRYETNRLRIVAQFFSHLLASDAIAWEVLHNVHLNEEETTSSSRIFIKILIEDLAQGVGMPGLTTRLKEDELQPALTGIFPTDNPKNTRFSINFFTAIGMGVLTEGMREWLKNMPKPAPPPALAVAAPRGRSASVSSYSSYSSYSSRSRSDSRSRSPVRKTRARTTSRVSRSPPARRRRSVSYSSRSRSRVRSRSRRRARSSSYDSRSPSLRRSRSPLPRRDRSPSRDSRAPIRRRRRSPSYEPHSRTAPRRRDDSSHSRSPPRKQARKDESRSPPRRATRYSSSRSPPPKRARDSRSLSPRRSNGRATARARSDSYSSRSRSPIRREASPPAKRASNRRRNTSSPESVTRSRPPPSAKSTTARDKQERHAAAKEDDEDWVHPSRRGLVASDTVGKGKGRARASDFN